jgi:hypothetical protein
MWFRAESLTSIHCWLITSASAAPSSPSNYLLSFEYRTVLSGHENKREIPGKHPVLSAVLAVQLTVAAYTGVVVFWRSRS